MNARGWMFAAGLCLAAARGSAAELTDQPLPRSATRSAADRQPASRTEQARTAYEKAWALEDRGAWDTSFRHYQQAVDAAASSRARDLAIRGQMRILAALMPPEDPTGAGPGDPAGKRVLHRLQEVYANNPLHEDVAQTLYLTGLWYEKRGRLPMAILHYEQAREQRRSAVTSRDAAFALARCRVTAFRECPRDMHRCRDALLTLDRVMPTHRDSPKFVVLESWQNSLEEDLARHAFEVAEYYRKTARRPDAAAAAFRQVMESFPDSALAHQADRRLREIAESIP